MSSLSKPQPTSADASPRASLDDGGQPQHDRPAAAAEECSGLDGALIGFKSVLLHVGLTTCAANTMIDSNAPIPAPGTLLEYTPQPSPDLLKSLQRQLELRAQSEANKSLRKLFNRLQAANQTTLEVAPKPVTRLRVPTPSILQLVQIWRGNCTLSLEVMGSLQKDSPASHEEDWANFAWRELRSLLVLASAGDYSCVAEDGSIVMPLWTRRCSPEPRRRSSRIALGTPAVLVRGNQEQKVLLRNISGLGIALEGVTEAYSGEEVLIRIPDGEEIAGMIRWYREGKAGIEVAKQQS